MDTTTRPNRWESIWWIARRETPDNTSAYALTHNSIWLYAPSIKTDPSFLIGLHKFRVVTQWLHEHELTTCLRNGYSNIIFDHYTDMIYFKLKFSEDIRVWDY